MRPEVVEKSRARTGNFAPAVADFRAIPIDAGFEQDDSSDEIAANRILDGEKVAIPAPVLEHRKQDIVGLRDGGEMSGLFDCDSKWLVHDDIAAGTHRRFGGRRMWFIWAPDYHA